jgi:PmbA protein
MNRLELAQKLVEKSLKAGAQEVEAFIMDSSEVSISIKDGQAETVNYTDDSGYGMRILIDGKMGFASSNNLNIDAADGLITRLISYTQKHTPDEHNVLPDKIDNPLPDGSLEQFDEKLTEIAVEDKIKFAQGLEAAAKETDSRIMQTPYVRYGDSSRLYAVASSKGIAGEYRRSEAYGAILAMGMETSSEGQPDPASAQTGVAIDVMAGFTGLDPGIIGRKAAKFALRMLGAGSCKTGEMAAVFPPESGFNFIQLVADMVAADQIQKKKSFYAGKLGEMVGSEKVSIIDDGRLPGGLVSSEFDSEGVPTTTTDVIKDGRLSSFLYDSYTAHRGETRSTGNGIRRTYASKPFIGPTNFYMKAGDISRDNLIGSVKDGIYITEVSGLHVAVDQVTGNFSVPGKGILIKSGELAQPVSGLSISGNIFNLFNSVDAVADDLTWEPRENVIGAPTFRVSRIKISGK